MKPIKSEEEAERARQEAYEVMDTDHTKSMELWKALALYDHTIDHGEPIEAWALEYDDNGDRERADRAYRVAIMIDPIDIKISNYAAFLHDTQRLREAWTLFSSIGEQGNDAVRNTAYELAMEIEAKVGPDVLKVWNSEPLNVEVLTRASDDDLQAFRREL